MPHKETALGIKLLDFAKNIKEVLKQSNGDVETVLKAVSRGGNDDDARLLLTTALLLQDGQQWQDLWYEGEVKGTPLYLVAPRIFHDAMKRLNINWGHGAMDYEARANASLGAFNKPLANANQQGLSSAEFEKKVGALLR